MAEVSEKKVRTLADLVSMKLHCGSPERDLVVYPRWLCFQSPNQYKTPLFVQFFIENREQHPVTYNIKCREKIFRISSSCGILMGGEKKHIKLFLISSDDWPLAIPEYSNKRIKLAVESLKVPKQIEPVDSKEGTCMSRNIWKRSFNEWPLERLYTKISVLIMPPPNSSNPSSSSAPCGPVKA